MNLFTKKPQWLFRALGLQDFDLPQTLAVDQVVATVDIAQSGWSSGRFFNIEAECTSTTSAAIGPASFPTLPGGLLVDTDETVVVLGISYFNNTAGSVRYDLRLSSIAPLPPRTALLTQQTLAAGAALGMAEAAVRDALPLVIPPGWALVAGNVGAPAIFLQLWGVRLPAGVKPL